MRLYRVSSDLKRKTYERNGMTVVTQEMEQWGRLYYFRKFSNAAKAAEEFGTSIVVMIGDTQTKCSDDWY